MVPAPAVLLPAVAVALDIVTPTSGRGLRSEEEGRGYTLTGDVGRLPNGEEILRYELRLGDGI